MLNIVHYHQVVKNKLVGPDFVWLFPGWFMPQWWTYNDTNCSADEMKSALDHSLGFRGNSEVTKNPSRVLVSDKVSIFSWTFCLCVCLLECFTI